ncbi:MAG: hypothetical protein AWU54_973, partial [Candidatus Frackibacter sp. T328-2]
MAKAKDKDIEIIARNKKARHDFYI